MQTLRKKTLILIKRRTVGGVNPILLASTPLTPTLGGANCGMNLPAGNYIISLAVGAKCLNSTN